jgi:hypothetical protein
MEGMDLGLHGDFMSGFQPSASVALVTQAYGLGWDVAAPLALSKSWAAMWPRRWG